MPAALADFAPLVPPLVAALRELEAATILQGLPPLAGREWHDLLVRKLVPQLGDNVFLVVAVTGGTNIGKSVVFNHLAGFRASASSPLASMTKHPVCLVPEGFSARHGLARIFPQFELRDWRDPADALQESEADLLFLRTSDRLPGNLLVLDTPDIDSDAPVNWHRADAVRQSADVLIAVLTPRNYNDAAVKQFFRKAAAEGRAVVIVFNQCDLPDDESYWPLWLETFSRETGVTPLYVYLAPRDRPAAESISLMFAERVWPIPKGGAEPSSTGLPLQEVFARLRFAEIKLQTLRGSLSYLVDERDGIPAYLREVSAKSAEFRAVAGILSTHRLAEVNRWPAPPTPLMIAEVRRWWSTQREGWSASVHGFYDSIGQTVSVPFKFARTWMQGPTIPPWDVYRQQEWSAVIQAVSEVYAKLEQLSDRGHSVLRERLEAILAGRSRSDFLQSLHAEHTATDLESLLIRTVQTELQSFRAESPHWFQWFKRLDEATAAARPMLTIVLGVTGVGLPVGEAATHLASQGLLQGALHVAGDVVAGAGVATVGETAISATAAGGTGYLQAKFHGLQQAFTRQRVVWLAERLDAHLLGQLTHDIETAANVSQGEPFATIDRIVREWTRALSVEGQRGRVPGSEAQRMAPPLEIPDR